MKRLIFDLAFIVGIILIAVFYFGAKLTDVLKEAAYFYLAMVALFVGLCCYIGYWLTKAMKPPKQKKKT